MNPRPMSSPHRPLRACPAYSLRRTDAHRRAYRATSSFVFSPPPYEPQGSGQASFGYAQADRASSVGRTSLLTQRVPAVDCWQLYGCAFCRDHATRLASCGSRSTVEAFRPHDDWHIYYTRSRVGGEELRHSPTTGRAHTHGSGRLKPAAPGRLQGRPGAERGQTGPVYYGR